MRGALHKLRWPGILSPPVALTRAAPAPTADEAHLQDSRMRWWRSGSRCPAAVAPWRRRSSRRRWWRRSSSLRHAASESGGGAPGSRTHRGRSHCVAGGACPCAAVNLARATAALPVLLCRHPYLLLLLG
ncbi:hypothetical protein C2845_PM09G15430 [Panicum miliaceum]|uniref:Uncharacterized protein n=1 Tax=Panicum miliaceum TaxID=4540 RepID=A0A3L6RX76_PANMI|nr:hypothetical protein C2845_PM09G15430 [Panicum miliaceum]